MDGIVRLRSNEFKVRGLQGLRRKGMVNYRRICTRRLSFMNRLVPFVACDRTAWEVVAVSKNS